MCRLIVARRKPSDVARNARPTITLTGTRS
jgi:hypothetical protein